MFEIVSLSLSHVVDLTEAYVNAPPCYSQYFTPFSFDVETLTELLTKKRLDLYFAIVKCKSVAGFYMLRGFDQGYEIPAYGVWIAPSFSGSGLALMTLNHAVVTCKALGCQAIMLKVHPNNLHAKAIYEKYGFKQVNSDVRNGNIVYKLALEQQ